MYINKSVMILEPASQKTLQCAKDSEKQKNLSDAAPLPVEPIVAKKNVKKEPNPLSTKRAKAASEIQPNKRVRVRK